MRSRRMSVTAPPMDFVPEVMPNKRHTLSGAAEELDKFPMPPVDSPEEISSTPAQSPTRSSFGFTPDKRAGQTATILLRRASTSQRVIVDRGLIDVFSESCATARSKAQLHHALFLPDGTLPVTRDRMANRESTMLRRRRSFLDTRAATFDIAFSGEIRGSVMPVRHSRSTTSRRRVPPIGRPRAGSFGSKGNESATEVEGTVDETAMSDFGTLTGRLEYSRANSTTSISRMASPRRSLSNLRKPEEPLLNRRKTASAYNLNARHGHPDRAKSMPGSPICSPFAEQAPPLLTKSASDGPPDFFREPGEGSPVYALGNGYTNQAERPLSNSKWGSLRRSISFVKSARNSTVSLIDLASGSSTTDFGEQIRSQGSDEAMTTNASVANLSDRSGDDDDARETGPGVPSTPKKKRHSIFQSLRGFTPI